MEKVAFIGLGAMGVRMAQNLLNSGYEVTVWNRTPERANQLVENGASLADTPKIAANNADYVVVMVRDDVASRTVWLDEENGAFWGMKPDAIAIDSSTLSIDWTKQLAEKAKELNINFLEAPVSGSRPHAEAGQLVYFVGGDQALCKQSESLLLSMGAKINHTQEAGVGALTKLFTNTLLGMQVATLAELMAMAKKQNVDISAVVEAVSATSSWSPAAAWVAGSMLKEDYDPMFTVDLIEKDLGYALDAANAHSPVIEAARNVFKVAIEKDLGEQNMSSVAKLYK